MSSSLGEAPQPVSSSQRKDDGHFSKLLSSQKSKQMQEQPEDKENKKGNILRPSPVSSCSSQRQRPPYHRQLMMMHHLTRKKASRIVLKFSCQFSFLISILSLKQNHFASASSSQTEAQQRTSCASSRDRRRSLEHAPQVNDFLPSFQASKLA
jgi:hypothetical protein